MRASAESRPASVDGSRGKRVLQRLCFTEPVAWGCSHDSQQSVGQQAGAIGSVDTAAPGGSACGRVYRLTPARARS